MAFARLLTILLICVTFGCIASYAKAHGIQPFVIGGQEALKGQFPYIVSMQKYLRHLCGGSIVSRKWVVTAAQCISSPNGIVAVGGLLRQKEDHPDNQIIPAIDVIHHPGYGSKLNINNVALVRLEFGFGYNEFVRPIVLPTQCDDFSGEAIVSGWGRFDIGSPEYSETLQYLQMSIISTTECNELLKSIGTYPYEVYEDHHVCTLPEQAAQSVCDGDSGSPLVQDGNILIGIAVSSEPKCGLGVDSRLPNIFTKASSVTDFILEYVENQY